MLLGGLECPIAGIAFVDIDISAGVVKYVTPALTPETLPFNPHYYIIVFILFIVFLIRHFTHIIILR